MVAGDAVLRLARDEDADAIDALMKASTAAIFPRFYSQAQTDASVEYIASVDKALIEDRTYFVVEAQGEIVACGGWSKRDKLYTGSGESAGGARLLDPMGEPARVRAMFVRDDWTRRGLGTQILQACEAAAKEHGFQRLALGATLPGVPLYERFGFVATHEMTVTLPDSTDIAAVAMEKAIS